MFDELAAVGVDYEDVTDTLEREGVEKFGWTPSVSCWRRWPAH